jgi:hypothetical protein
LGHPVSLGHATVEKAPSADSLLDEGLKVGLTQYIVRMVVGSGASGEAAMLGLVYLLRLVPRLADPALDERTCAQLYATTLRLGTKTHEDCSRPTAEYACVAHLSPHGFCALERQVAAALDFDLYVTAAEYDSLYCELLLFNPLSPHFDTDIAAWAATLPPPPRRHRGPQLALRTLFASTPCQNPHVVLASDQPVPERVPHIVISMAVNTANRPDGDAKMVVPHSAAAHAKMVVPRSAAVDAKMVASSLAAGDAKMAVPRSAVGDAKMVVPRSAAGWALDAKYAGANVAAVAATVDEGRPGRDAVGGDARRYWESRQRNVALAAHALRRMRRASTEARAKRLVDRDNGAPRSADTSRNDAQVAAAGEFPLMSVVDEVAEMRDDNGWGERLAAVVEAAASTGAAAADGEAVARAVAEKALCPGEAC